MPPQTSFSDNNDHERNPIFEPVGKQVEGMNSDQPTTEDDAPDEGRLVDTIESLCMNCHENVGATEGRLFRRLIVDG